MGINRKCPKCGSEKVQLSDNTKNHGCLWLCLFGTIYIFWLMIKWTIGFMILIFFDWWMAIIKKDRILDMCGNQKNGLQEAENIIIVTIAGTILKYNYIQNNNLQVPVGLLTKGSGRKF